MPGTMTLTISILAVAVVLFVVWRPMRSSRRRSKLDEAEAILQQQQRGVEWNADLAIDDVRQRLHGAGLHHPGGPDGY